MRGLLGAALIALTLGPAFAQEAGPAEEPMVLRVRPSGIDDPATAARERQERLQRRMAEADYLFRNICVQCGSGINRPGAYAPFNPIDALGARR